MSNKSRRDDARREQKKPSELEGFSLGLPLMGALYLWTVFHPLQHLPESEKNEERADGVCSMRLRQIADYPNETRPIQSANSLNSSYNEDYNSLNFDKFKESMYLLKKARERPEGFFESLVEPLKPSGRCSLSPKS